MNINDLLQGPMKDIILGQLTNQLGISDENKANTAIDGVIGTLLNAVANNASTPEGQSGLLKALDRDHDGSILDDLTGFLGGSFQPSSPKALDGAGILGHLFKGQQDTAVESISKASGLDTGKILKIMMTLAPIVLGMLGKAKQQAPAPQQAQQQGGGLFDFLKGATTTVNKQPTVQSVLTSILAGNNKQNGGLVDELVNGAMKSVFSSFFK